MLTAHGPMLRRDQNQQRPPPAICRQLGRFLLCWPCMRRWANALIPEGTSQWNWSMQRLDHDPCIEMNAGSHGSAVALAPAAVPGGTGHGARVVVVAGCRPVRRRHIVECQVNRSTVACRMRRPSGPSFFDLPMKQCYDYLPIARDLDVPLLD